MEEHKVLWDGNTAAREPPLRRPNIPTTNLIDNTNIQNLQESTDSLDLSTSFNNSINLEDDILSTSTLSVDAKEWFPPNYDRNATSDTFNGPTRRSVQNRLHKFKVQPEKQTANNHGHTESLQNGLVVDETSKDLSKLQEIMSTLVEDPGRFDDLLGTFIETLGPYYEDVTFVSKSTDVIVDQALREPNLQYNAARLCSIIEEQCPIFRSALCTLCEKKVKENAYDCNLALFLAEIFAQLHYEEVYGQFVVKTLKSVLSLGDGQNVKSVCQALKLTGAALETNHKQALDEIFKQLQITKSMQLTHIENLIESVITLRNSNWGRGQSSPVMTNNNFRYPNHELQDSNDDPIFYGPDGKELTDEERQFLSDNCFYQGDYSTDDSDPDGVWEPDPEMDEEIQAAFRQFVKSNK